MNLAMRLMIGCLVALAAPPVVAQPPPAPAQLDALAEAQIGGEIAAIKARSATEEVLVRYRQAQLEQLMREDRHRVFALWAQAIFGVVLTIFVLTVVAAGIYLSYLQFKATGGSTVGEPPSRFMLSKEGFELSSWVIGLFVLMASMFFFYFYIKEVYPIRRIAEDAQAAAPTTQAQNPAPAVRQGETKGP